MHEQRVRTPRLREPKAGAKWANCARQLRQPPPVQTVHTCASQRSKKSRRDLGARSQPAMSTSCTIAAALAFTAPPLLPAHPRLRPLRVVASAGPPPYEEAKKGFYVRPSAAVERGGGFFIPGLEGYKLRLAVALLLSAGRCPTASSARASPDSRSSSPRCSASAAPLGAGGRRGGGAARGRDCSAAALKPRVTEGEALREQMRRDLDAET